MTYKTEKLANNIDRIIIEGTTIRVKLLNYGATIEEIEMINKNGVFETITLTYQDPNKYLICEQHGFVGVNIARHGGRIKDSRFTLNNKEWKLEANNGTSNLHSGTNGIYKKPLGYKIIGDKDNIAVNFKHIINHEDDHFPGNLDLDIQYIVTNDKLTVNYVATSDEDTICNITNHSYFNLSGNLKEPIGKLLIKDTFKNIKLVDQEIFISDEKPFSVLTGGSEWTEMDKIVSNDLLINGNGLDNPLELNDGQISVKDPVSGRRLDITTSYPAVVLYSSNYPFGTPMKYNEGFVKNVALAIEPQYLPNDINVNKENSKTILRANNKYKHTIEYKFSI